MVTLRRRRPSAAADDQDAQKRDEKDEEDDGGGGSGAKDARAVAPPPPPAPPPQALASRLVRLAFLPQGYPESVTPDYLPFVLWNALQGLSSYVRGVLSSAAVLASLGVGEGAASPLAAATLTAARDAAGTAGGIVFASLQGGSFDAAAKQWRLFADVLNDCAMALDLASPLLARAWGPAGFLAVASAAALARALVGVAGGATGAALTHHFSRGRAGAAEISAKADSRERAASIVGSLVGVGAARACVRAGPWAGWALFAALTILHIWANARAMRCLVLDTLTPARIELLLRPPAASRAAAPAAAASSTPPATLTPKDAAALETLLPPPFERAAGKLRALLSAGRARPPARIRFGAPLGELLLEERRRRWQGAGADDKDKASSSSSSSFSPARVLASLRRRSALPDSYLVAVAGGGRGEVLVAVRRGADADARLRAFAHAARLARADGKDDEDDEDAAARWARDEYPRWLRGLGAAGWQVDGASALLPRPEHVGEW